GRPAHRSDGAWCCRVCHISCRRPGSGRLPTGGGAGVACPLAGAGVPGRRCLCRTAARAPGGRGPLATGSHQGHQTGGCENMTQHPADRRAAIALKYDAATDHAPRVVAKGRGLVAEKIIALAQAQGIPMREDPDLVQMLTQIDLDQEIPPTLYQVVAE